MLPPSIVSPIPDKEIKPILSSPSLTLPKKEEEIGETPTNEKVSRKASKVSFNSNINICVVDEEKPVVEIPDKKLKPSQPETSAVSVPNAGHSAKTIFEKRPGPDIHARLAKPTEMVVEPVIENPRDGEIKLVSSPTMIKPQPNISKSPPQAKSVSEVRKSSVATNTDSSEIKEFQKYQQVQAKLNEEIKKRRFLIEILDHKIKKMELCQEEVKPIGSIFATKVIN